MNKQPVEEAWDLVKSPVTLIHKADQHIHQRNHTKIEVTSIEQTRTTCYGGIFETNIIPRSLVLDLCMCKCPAWMTFALYRSIVNFLWLKQKIPKRELRIVPVFGPEM